MVPSISCDIIMSIFSFGISITSIVLSVLTLRQNSKRIEESTRPVVCIVNINWLETDAYI